MEQWKLAKTCFEKSMSEHRTPEIKTLLSEVEKKIVEEEKKAYVDPVKAEQEKELGNEYFKKGRFLSSVEVVIVCLILRLSPYFETFLDSGTQCHNLSLSSEIKIIHDYLNVN